MHRSFNPAPSRFYILRLLTSILFFSRAASQVYCAMIGGSSLDYRTQFIRAADSVPLLLSLLLSSLFSLTRHGPSRTL